MASDPYRVLGVTESVTDVELRAAYRRMVKLHHPDHNRGSSQAKVRFEEVQAAYAQVLQLRAEEALGAKRTAGPDAASGAARAAAPPRASSGGSEMDARIAAMERDIAERKTRERARLRAEEERRQARAAAARAVAEERLGRPSREELGYVDSDDNFSSILADALDQVAERLRSKPGEQ